MIRACRPVSRKYSPIDTPAYGARYCNEAGSLAVAETMMLYAMAPDSSSILMTRRVRGHGVQHHRLRHGQRPGLVAVPRPIRRRVDGRVFPRHGPARPDHLR